ncbi:MAG: hypothetical protein B6I20_10005 [Bacteroidetes bacterium 4572_117]|nr:MAG: hypothetical protein B6I20_10005 [Bacteroidetes bacterium 4572_117]
MEVDSKYSIYFWGLADGQHHFSFQVSKGFLANFDKTEINDLEIKIDAIMEKTPRHLGFTFHIQGIVNLQCDRCLDFFDFELNFENNLHVSFGEETSDITNIDDRMILSRKEDKIDLAKHFYDYINLQIPLQKIHPDDEKGYSTCNTEMLENIEKHMGHENPLKEVDPRWDKLKNLYN